MNEKYTQSELIRQIVDEFSCCEIFHQLDGYDEEKTLSPEQRTAWNKIQILKNYFKSLFNIDLAIYKTHETDLKKAPYQFSRCIYDALFFFCISICNSKLRSIIKRVLEKDVVTYAQLESLFKIAILMDYKDENFKNCMENIYQDIEKMCKRAKNAKSGSSHNNLMEQKIFQNLIFNRIYTYLQISECPELSDSLAI